MAKAMVLEIYSGGWGLPSVDQRCLEIMAFARFSGVPLKLKRSDNPLWAPGRSLPAFQHGNTVLNSLADVVPHFRKENYSAQLTTDGRSGGDVMAYENMMRTRFNPAFMFTWWLDEQNYTEVIRPLFAKKLPVPLNYFYPGYFQRRMKQYLWHVYNLPAETPSEEDLNWRIIEKDSYKKAIDCLNLLSAKLGENEFFNGNSPRYVDAVIFSYLAPLLKIPLPKSSLQAHLRACPNLVAFVDRVLQRYFPPTPEDAEAVPGCSFSNKSGKGSEDAGRSSRTKNFLVCLGGLVAMGLYSIYAGHVYVNVARKPIADIETLESAVEDFYEPSDDGDQT